MSIIQDIYKFLSENITQDQLVYFGALLGLIAAVGSAYKEAIGYVWQAFKSWLWNVRTLFVEVQLIPEINRKIEELYDTSEKKAKDIIHLNKEIDDIKPKIESNGKITADVLKDIKVVVDKIHVVEGELSTNSGKSLKDLIMKIAESTDKMIKSVESLDFEVKRVEARQWNIMINSSDVPMFETDKAGLCLKANRAYLDLVGMTMDDLRNNGWINIIYLDDRKLVQYEWDTAIEDERTFDLRFKIQNNSANKMYLVRCVASPVFVGDQLVGYIGRYNSIQEVYQDEKTNLWVVKPK